MESITVTDARAALPALLDAVTRGDEVTLTRHGRPVAVLIRPDRLRARRAAVIFDEASRLHDMLDEANTSPLADAPPLDEDRAEVLLAEVRSSRADR